MKFFKIIGSWIVLVLFFLGGCKNCRENRSPMTAREETTTQQNDSLKFLRPKDILKEEFSYKHNIEITLKKAQKEQVSSEKIEIYSEGRKLHLKKQIDEHHFYEIYRDKNEYLVKNRLGDWRFGDNKEMYKQIFLDGLGSFQWVLSQFGLESYLRNRLDNESGKKEFIIKNLVIAKESAFIADVAKSMPNNFNVESAIFSGMIKMNEKRIYIKKFDFVVNIQISNESSIALKGRLAYTPHLTQELIKRPQAKKVNDFNYPVNISKRFNKLFSEW